MMPATLTRVRVTREAAIKYLIAQMFDADSNDLTTWMDWFLGEDFKECEIVQDGTPNDNDVL